MKKSFADTCLDLAAAATPGPWIADPKRCSLYIREDNGFLQDTRHRPQDAEFIAASREMVPELARRLSIALETISMLLENDECRHDQDCDHCLALQVIDDLEAMTGGK